MDGYKLQVGSRVAGDLAPKGRNEIFLLLVLIQFQYACVHLRPACSGYPAVTCILYISNLT